MLRSLVFIALTLAAPSAFAGASDWQEIAPGVKARLVASDTLTDGITMAGLELDLPAGTNTYWRIPGETGIPTEFDFSGSSGVVEPVVHWPHPEVDRSRGFTDYIYTGSTVLPIEFQAEDRAVLDVTVELGICSDMCVPASAKLTLPLNFAAPDTAQSIRLDQAMARTPILWDQPGRPFGSVEAGLDGSLHLLSPDPSVDPASLIADLGDPAVLFDAPQKS
ncbi:MAG TPA: protein-disulfide reductase DsbD domain-containing protein, partial [Devosia sp.]|nr:protein-disulfide reductase DsbD domain-containing protein [Devosia sp.]